MDEIGLHAGGRKGGMEAGARKAFATAAARRGYRLGNHRLRVYCTAPGTAGVSLSRASFVKALCTGEF